MTTLTTLINELQTQIQNCERLNEAVSQSSVGWHIQHTLLTTKKIISALEKSDPAQYKWDFSLTRSFVFTFNKIPRGKGKAPQSVQPAGNAEPAELIAEVQKLLPRISLLDELQPNHFFVHPYFGRLNVKAARKFLEIHTRHHLAIISDILK